MTSESKLRASVIRLAHAKPELREHLLPLVKEAASDSIQERINEAIRASGLWDMKALSKFLREKGDEEAALVIENREKFNIDRTNSPAYRFADKIKEDIIHEAKGKWIQEQLGVRYPMEGGDLVYIYFNGRIYPNEMANPEKAKGYLVALKVSDSGQVKVQKVNKAEWKKTLKLAENYGDIVTVKLDALSAYVKKHGGKV